jgi:hypothetical protein
LSTAGDANNLPPYGRTLKVCEGSKLYEILGNVNMQDLIGLALVGKDIVFRFFFRDEELGWMDDGTDDETDG